jgi:hypothetical protein
VAPPPVDLWPDNAGIFEVFAQLVTQWRIGGRGPIGLDYNTLPFVLRMNRVPRAEWPEYFESIRVMENAALDAMNED